MQPLTLADLQKGATVPGDCGAPHDAMPPWMDQDRFDRGRDFIQRHMMGVFLSQFMALLVGFSVTPLLDVLLYTGKSSTVEAAMRRYISTGRRLLLWHDGDVWDVNSKAHASVMKVRNMHRKVAQDITKDRQGCDSGGKQGDKTEHQVDKMGNGHTDQKRRKHMNNNQVDKTVDRVEKMGNGHTDHKQSKHSCKNGMKGDKTVHVMGNGHTDHKQSTCKHCETGTKADSDGGKVYISQYDMALTQAGFVGFVLYPEKFGICCTVDELEDYIFFWRGIGYLLGIEDRYNLCSGNYAETCSIIYQIENEVVKPAFLDPPQPGFDVTTTSFVEGMQLYFKDRQLTKGTMFGFARDAFGLPMSEVSWVDWCRLIVMKWMVWLVERIPGLSTFLIRNLSVIVKRENPD